MNIEQALIECVKQGVLNVVEAPEDPEQGLGLDWSEFEIAELRMEDDDPHVS